MSRLVKSKFRWHKVTIETDRKEGELLLVMGGKRCYLWAGRTNVTDGCVTASGAATLRKLANAILKEVGQ